ncbi:MAG: hypothetical protein U0736_21995 [Gemmataceae bacterium]
MGTEEAALALGRPNHRPLDALARRHRQRHGLVQNGLVEEIGHDQLASNAFLRPGIIEGAQVKLHTPGHVREQIARNAGFHKRFHLLPRFVRRRLGAAFQLDRIDPQRRRVTLRRFQVPGRRR